MSKNKIKPELPPLASGMSVRFTVGEFAEICGVSKQTLIFYDKKDVIRPKFKDPHNGYRYYTADQLEQFDSITILREMGFSLNEIREYMENRSLKSSLEMLEGQRQAIHDKIEKLTAIEKRIDEKAASLQLFSRQDASFQICTLPSQLLAVEKVRDPGGMLEIDIALKKIIKRVINRQVDHFYQVGDTVCLEDLLAENFLHFEYAFVPTDVNDGSVTALERPAGQYAVQCHFGPYTAMGQTYLQMLENIAAQGFQPVGRSYEFCVLDSFTSSTPENYCTQIQIPVKESGL